MARIRTLQEEVEGLHQQAHRTGLLRLIVGARPLVLLTAPIVYLGCLPFIAIDGFVTVYQVI